MIDEDCRTQCVVCGRYEYPDNLVIYGKNAVTDVAVCIGCNMDYLMSLPEEYYDEFILRGHEAEFEREYEGHHEYDDKADFCFWKNDDGFEDFIREVMS